MTSRMPAPANRVVRLVVFTRPWRDPRDGGEGSNQGLAMDVGGRDGFIPVRDERPVERRTDGDCRRRHPSRDPGSENTLRKAVAIASGSEWGTRAPAPVPSISTAGGSGDHRFPGGKSLDQHTRCDLFRTRREGRTIVARRISEARDSVSK